MAQGKQTVAGNPFPYTDGSKRYHTYDYWLKSTFGGKCAKIPLDAGFSCPNLDGRCGVGGCIYCSGRGSGDFAEVSSVPLREQYDRQREFLAKKWPTERCIPYFQARTNTYAPVERLRQLYYQAIAPEDIVGLAIGTRPDCLGADVVQLLAEINRVKPVSVELGLQTIHEDTARYIRRGYTAEVYFDAVKRLKQAGIEVVTHIILGLPGETPDMMVKTTEAAVKAGTDGVKFHLLHVLKNTDLAKEYAAGKFACLSLEEYADILKACLAVVPETLVIHRITGDGAKKDLIAPLWSGDKKRVLNYLHKVLNTER